MTTKLEESEKQREEIKNLKKRRKKNNKKDLRAVKGREHIWRSCYK